MIDQVAMRAEVCRFARDCEQLIRNHDEYHAEHSIEMEFGTKFVRFVSAPKKGQKTSYLFVALVDGETKALGPWKQGDVLKCATWKQPAKHSRGNIFDTDKGMKYIGVYGPQYLDEMKKNP